MQRLQGWSEQGNTRVSVAGATSTTKVQGSFPLCTVTIYLAGTGTLASLFSDDSSPPTVKGNPFTAASDGSWFAYIANGRYDVHFSGTGIATPFAIGDFSVGLGNSGVPSFAFADLPTSKTQNAGNLARVTDVTRGLWMDTGNQWSSLSGRSADVTEFGAKGDGVTDDILAFEAAFASFPYQSNNLGGHEDSVGGTVYVPRGNYYLSRTLYIDRCNALIGEGGYAGSQRQPVILKFAAGQHGVVIWTTGLGTALSPTRYGFGNILKNIHIRSLGGQAGTGFFNGLSSLGGWRLDGVSVDGFSGHGFYLQAAIAMGVPAWAEQPGSEMFTQPNGGLGGYNDWSMRDCNVTSCGGGTRSGGLPGHGLCIIGGDNNGGLCENLVAQVCTGVGLSDQSAIGCTFVDYLPEGNLLGSFQSLTAAGNCTVVGSNMGEGNGSEANRYSPGTLFVGCLVPNSTVGGERKPVQFRSAGGAVRSSTIDGSRSNGGTSGVSAVTSYFLGGNASDGAPFTEFWGDSTQNTQFRFQYDTSGLFYFWDIQSAIRYCRMYSNVGTLAARLRGMMHFNDNGFLVGRQAALVFGNDGDPNTVIDGPPGSLYLRNDGGVGASLYVKQSALATLTGWTPMLSGVKGTFTCAANKDTVVAQAAVLAGSNIQLTPTNAAAATLMGSAKSLYVSAKVASTSFTVTTADGTAAAGTETFAYTVLN